jgi:hypothetical protein
MVQVTEDKRPSSFEMIAAAINRVVEQAPRAQRLVPRFIDRGDGHLHRSLGARPITASRLAMKIKVRIYFRHRVEFSRSRPECPPVWSAPSAPSQDP